MDDTTASVMKANTRNGVLVVEDSAIIAMDVEEMLGAMGVSNITVAASCAAALDALDNATPQFALLDFKLGDGTSEPVATALSQRSIPFWFVTGYGDALERLSGSAASGVIQKPYSTDDLQKIVDQLGG